MNPVTDNTNRHFKGQHSSEVVECFCRKHWIILVKDFLGFFLFVGLLILTSIYFKPIYNFFVQDSLVINLLAFGLVGFFTFYIHKFFLRMIQYFLEIVIITNYRIVVLKKSLYLKDSKDATDLPKIQDIIKHQNGILKNILKFGDLEITLSSSSTTKVLKNIPNPDYHFRKISKVKSGYVQETTNERRQRKEGLDNKVDMVELEKPIFAGKDSLG
jgi:hypothetical protein